MTRVITFSTVFPTYHPKKGQPTGFVEKILNGEKVHTIRNGNRWKVGDKFSPRIWAGKPYASKQQKICDDLEVKRVWTFEIKRKTGAKRPRLYINNYLLKTYWIVVLARNDGLKEMDFLDWFQYPKEFSGQIICWNSEIRY